MQTDLLLGVNSLLGLFPPTEICHVPTDERGDRSSDLLVRVLTEEISLLILVVKSTFTHGRPGTSVRKHREVYSNSFVVNKYIS